MEEDLQWKTTYNRRQPPIEDDLKLSKLEFLSNRLLDHTQFCNISLYYPKYFVYGLQWKITTNWKQLIS